jgi:hypothetical protein
MKPSRNTTPRDEASGEQAEGITTEEFLRRHQVPESALERFLRRCPPQRGSIWWLWWRPLWR